MTDEVQAEISESGYTRGAFPTALPGTTPCREYMVHYCVYADDDIAPVCLWAAIQVPDDVEDGEAVAVRAHELWTQIRNELPMHMRKAYGRTPVENDSFWQIAPSPECLDPTVRMTGEHFVPAKSDD